MTMTLDKLILDLMKLRKEHGNLDIYVSDGRSGVVDEFGGIYEREAREQDNDYGVELEVGKKYAFISLG